MSGISIFALVVATAVAAFVVGWLSKPELARKMFSIADTYHVQSIGRIVFSKPGVQVYDLEGAAPEGAPKLTSSLALMVIAAHLMIAASKGKGP